MAGPIVRIHLPPAESQRTFGSSQDDGCFDGKEIMRSSNRRAGAAGGRQGQPRLSRRPANPACRLWSTTMTDAVARRMMTDRRLPPPENRPAGSWAGRLKLRGSGAPRLHLLRSAQHLRERRPRIGRMDRAHASRAPNEWMRPGGCVIGYFVAKRGSPSVMSNQTALKSTKI